jgi:hypothetical protein
MDPGSTIQVFSLGEDSTKPYRRQKTHKKTRLGCLTCKLKKVKVRIRHYSTGDLRELTRRSAMRLVQYALDAEEMADHAHIAEERVLLH